MNEPKMKFEPMSLLIVAVIFGAISLTFGMAVFAEVALPDGLVRYTTLAVFVGAALICSGGLAWFVKIALYEWGSYRDIVPVDEGERILIRSDDRASLFKELDKRHPETVWVRAPPMEAEPLENANIDDSLYDLLSNGGNSK